MKATGTIEITEELTLENPTMEIKTTYFECVFTDEDGNKHSRLIKEGDELFNKFE
jgi:hypothetical protein